MLRSLLAERYKLSIHRESREGPHGRVRIRVGKNATKQVEFLKITMPELAEVLTPSLDRVVVGATGLTGSYQLQDWSVPPPPTAAAGPIPAPPTSLSFPAIERSGLKLEMRKAPVDLIVVDLWKRRRRATKVVLQLPHRAANGTDSL